MSAIGANANGQASRLRPYLTTVQLISLAAFAAPIISLLFILFRLRASSDTAQRSIDEAKNSLQASCLAAERAASVGASLPRYLAQGVNEQITDGVRATMEGVRIGLTLSLTATEAIIEFIIDMYRSTFLCLLELVIRGGLSVVIASVQEITSFVNTTLSSVTAGIAGDIQSANNVIQTALNAIKNIPFVGNNINIPQFSIPSAAQLSSIQIPTTFEDRLKSLNSTLPTLDQLRDKLDAVISIPFQLVKKDINDTFAASQASFIATPLPVPKEATVTFCGDTISTSFDDLAKTLIRVAQIGIAVVIGCMVLLFFAYAFVTWWSQRSLRQNIERIKVLWFGDGNATTDRLLAFDALISHPIWSRIVQILAEKFQLSQEKYDALTWFGLYVFHPAPLACLLIGIFGLISVQIQLAIIPIMTHGFSDQAANDVSNLSTKIATKLNETMWQDSVAYAQTLNKQIGSVQDTINNDVFGWVNATIVPLNNTIATFYSEVQDVVKTVFGNTPLDAPAQEFIRCIIGSKVSGIENALTFLQKNLNVDLPRVDEGALVLSQSGVNEVAAPISAAAVGSSNNGEDGGFVGKIIAQYIKALEKERITFFIFLLLWVFVVVIALLIVAWHFLILPAIHKRGMREPRWLAGPRWEDSVTFVPDHEKQPSLEKVGMYDHGPTVVAIPSPLRKNHSVTSTSTKASSDGDHVRQRRAGDAQETSDLRSFLDARPAENEQGTFLGRLKRFTTIGRNTHTAKKNSDDGIIPVANHNVPRARPSNPRTNAGTQWFERLTIWGGAPSDAEPNITEPPKEPSRRRSPSNHGLTVDVTKASAQFITPRIIVERDDHPSEPVVVPTPPRPSPPSRSGSGDSGGSRRPGDYLSVPKPEPRRHPKPPVWLEAERNKKALPVLPDERPRNHGVDSVKDRRRQNSGSDSDTSRGPRRPPGLGVDNERSRHPAYPKPVVTYDPRGRPSQSGSSRHSRNSSVPPLSERARTDPKRQQQRNQVLSRPSSFDTADPFATPVKRTMELPAPLEPVKKNSLPTESSAYANPFSTPFDDSNAVPSKAANAELRSDAAYNFSFPSRRLNGAI